MRKFITLKIFFKKGRWKKNWITDYASWIVLSDPTVDRRFDSEKQHTNDQKLNLNLVEKLTISVKSM